MSWIYHTTSDDKYRYALGEVQDTTNKALFALKYRKLKRKQYSAR